MNITEVGDFIYDTGNTSYISEEDKLRGFTIEGKWKEVVNLYKSDPIFSTIKINESRGTALHVAVNDNNVEVVRNLVDSIISHKTEEALAFQNEKGDTPLHLAASVGFTDICECIIGINGERRYLIDIKNYHEESPLFVAALSWRKQTFVYLLSLNVNGNYSLFKDLIRSNGDSILHCAIKREFFDLALIIIDKYPNLNIILNRQGFSPLKLLATRPSAFKGGCNMIWWKRILYHCIPVGTLNVEEALEIYAMTPNVSRTNKICPKNYDTCYLFLHKCKQYARLLLMKPPAAEQKPNGFHEQKFLPENYATCLWFMKYACFYIIHILAICGVGVEEITKMKQKHKWSGQLLKIFMENPYESYLGSGGKPIEYVIGTDFISAFNPKKGVNNSDEPPITKTPVSETSENSETPESQTSNISKILESETAILTAARNGIVEIVDELIKKIPSSVYDVNLENKNVFLVAVENRRANVVEALRLWFIKSDKLALFFNLIEGVDTKENTVLHLAARISDRDWHISGSALKMMWHIKWFEYTRELVPEHFMVRTNKKDETAEELFRKSCEKLVEEGSKWFKDISESCSVVAVLLAGVAFATSSTVPGGNKSDTGEPILNGKPAFDTFAISSVIGLCFSVTSLIMFLSILTTQKEAKDFRIDLPRKLLLALSSLFLSMVALFVAFCSSHFFLIDHKFKNIVYLFYTVTCFPLTFYAVAQVPLYIELLRGILIKVPKTTEKDS